MIKKFFLSLCLISIAFNITARERDVKVRLLQTSDLHSSFYPNSMIADDVNTGSLARVHTLVEDMRKLYGDNVILLDNGDILQGQPASYYYNYIDTVSTHLCADMLNFMGYDAGNMGNHDIETGNSVFERWVKDCNFPILGANIIDVATGQPAFPPYLMVEKDGARIAVLGMITPAIPAWLPESLWKGLRFDDMEESARKWMKIIQEKEKPDAVVGLFHAGQNQVTMLDKYIENASLTIAQNVPGFDVVFAGHDHYNDSKEITNVAGQKVWYINPGSDGKVVGDVEMIFKKKGKRIVGKQVKGALTDVTALPVSASFMNEFAPQYDIVNQFVSKKIGHIDEDISTRDCYFGPSAFIDLIHQLQLDITHADISLTAPLSFDTSIKKGDIYVSDMFKLYKYENMLYVMKLSGKEIKGLLEESYGRWANQMTSADDHLLLFRKEGSNGGFPLANMSFNFDSAAGIIYTVDVTKPAGQRITIASMADGTPFDADKMYNVALNSYRGNGGGELLTKGAGIPEEELANRIIFATDKDLRYYLMQYIEKQGELTAPAMNQWKFIPEEWTVPAAKRDYQLLFGNK